MDGADEGDVVGQLSHRIGQFCWTSIMLHLFKSFFLAHIQLFFPLTQASESISNFVSISLQTVEAMEGADEGDVVAHLPHVNGQLSYASRILHLETGFRFTQLQVTNFSWLSTQLQ
jgi:hypothetical protein